MPWAPDCPSNNAAHQARLGALALSLASAGMALNTSAMHPGQAVGARSGGMLLAHNGYAWLHWAALGWLLVAIELSIWLMRQMAPAHLAQTAA